MQDYVLLFAMFGQGIGFSQMKKDIRLKQLTLRIPESLHRDFKVKTAKNGQSMGEVAIELIIKYLEKESDPM